MIFSKRIESALNVLNVNSEYRRAIESMLAGMYDSGVNEDIMYNSTVYALQYSPE